MDSLNRPGALGLALNLVGAVVVAWSLVSTHTAHRPVWVLVVSLAAVVAWAARGVCAIAGLLRTGTALALVAALGGSLTAAGTDGIAVVPAAIAVLILLGDVAFPLGAGAGVVIVSVALIPIGAVPFGTSAPALLAEMGGIVLGGFAGLSRRQFRRAEAQAAQLREREAAIREEAARIAIARDLHDVLAHSLGGLVIQLDAVDALLEAGDTGAARERVVAARGLAAGGLSEARRAVAALREPNAGGAAVDPPAFTASMEDLVAAHRSLGGEARVVVAGRPRTLTADQATALQRALQEALSNARKHAPGQPVRARLDWENDRVRLTVSTPLGDAARSDLAATGGGHGIEGMRERFAALPLGGVATAGVDGDAFTVTAEARLA
ncbi:histidine kinase [Leifsonia sp. NPDC080035]|uniref:histidine kinase n=1 Tax=Leifsonia sp. NPDC080035 TaxID=3143936 RepID=A0AAU7GC41_9MICO